MALARESKSISKRCPTLLSRPQTSNFPSILHEHVRHRSERGTVAMNLYARARSSGFALVLPFPRSRGATNITRLIGRHEQREYVYAFMLSRRRVLSAFVILPKPISSKRPQVRRTSRQKYRFELQWTKFLLVRDACTTFPFSFDGLLFYVLLKPRSRTTLNYS